MHEVIRDLHILINHRERTLRPRDRTAEFSPELREEWEERAAIMEYEGNMTREEAERLAFKLLTGRTNPNGRPGRATVSSPAISLSHDGTEMVVGNRRIWTALGYEGVAF